MLTKLTYLLASILMMVSAASATEPQHEETRLLIDLVRSAVEEVESKGAGPACEAFSQPDSSWLYGESYVFVLDAEGRGVCHPVQPGLEGRNLLELRDPSGRPVVRSFLREVDAGSVDGWVHYLWPVPGQQYTFYWKSSYVHGASSPEGSEYIVGSGVYQMKMERFFVVDQVEEAAELVAIKGAEAFSALEDEAGGFRFYDVYFFVLDDAGRLLLNAGFPENVGSNLTQLADAEGRLFVQEMLELVEQRDSGWVDYLWPRPGDTRPSRKSSYVRRVDREDGTYIVGAGVYLE